MTGKLDIMTPGMALTPELKKGVYDKMPEDDDSQFAAEHWMLTKMKKCIIMVAGSAAMKF
jgi:hypothetical protein